MRTLIVGGEFSEIGSEIYVPERCWRMVRIFSDVIAEPVFARRRVESTDRALFSAQLPANASLCSVTPPGRRPPWQSAFPDRDWNRAWYEQMISEVDAVYCRFSSWEGMPLYEIALERNKIVLASIHGDWAGVYQHLAADAQVPRNWLFARLNRASHEAMLRVAKSTRVLFCVGQLLYDQYGAAAPAAVTFANYLHREGDLRERDDTCATPPYRILFVGQLESRKGVAHLHVELPWATHGLDATLSGPGGQVSLYAIERFLARVTE
jgi:hypothetical protein